MSAVHCFDYTAAAELFPTPDRSHRFKQRTGSSIKFDRAAEAIRYAMEDLKPALLEDSFMEVGESLYNGVGIRNLYARDAFPFARRVKARAHPLEGDHE